MGSEKLTEKYMIREAAKQVGVETHVLRYWEKELSLDVPKNDMGHRFYTAQEIELLKQVKYLKDQGFHLKSIRMLKKNIEEVVKFDIAKLHSLRDRLNGQLLEAAEAGKEETKEAGGAEGKEQEEEQQTEQPIAVHTGVPAGKTTGKKVKIEEEKQEETQLLELELAEPEEQAMQRPFGVVQGGRTEKSFGVLKTGKEGQALEAEQEIDGRMEQFRAIMNGIIGEALRENNQELAEHVGENVSEKVMKEMDYMMRSQQQQEEERYRKLDETIRSFQKSRQEAAAVKEGAKKKKRGLFSIGRHGKA